MRMNRGQRAMHSPSLDSKPVIIVGGGLSGLAAAVELTSRNIPVVLLEQKPKLGGRAYSFTDATTGDVIDNGQHVLIVGYERTMRFLERIGTKQLLTVQDQPVLFLHHPTKGFCEFKLQKLPSPLHLLVGILTTDLFSFADKLRLLRAGSAMQRTTNDPSLDDMTIEQWLDAVGQSEETKRSFWEPLAVSIMNEHTAKASAKVFVHSLRHAFLGGWKNSSLAVPRVGLSELYVDGAVKFIEQRGAEVRPNADVIRVVVSDDKVTSIRLRDDSEIESRAAILAVPHYRLEELLPSAIPQQVIAPKLLSAPSTPIVSIHLWFENDFMPHEFVGVIGKRVQWIFNKRKINQETGKGGHISCVVSAADDFVGMTNDELVKLAMDDLKTVYNAVPSAPTHEVVVREKRATFSCTPEVEKLRPNHQTSISNLFLAGDWTNTGLPATIEGSIISGEKCAELAICEYLR